MFASRWGFCCYFLQQICPPPPNSLRSESLRSDSYTTILILTNDMLMGEIIVEPVSMGKNRKDSTLALLNLLGTTLSQEFSGRLHKLKIFIEDIFFNFLTLRNLFPQMWLQMLWSIHSRQIPIISIVLRTLLLDVIPETLLDVIPETLLDVILYICD